MCEPMIILTNCLKFDEKWTRAPVTAGKRQDVASHQAGFVQQRAAVFIFHLNDPDVGIKVALALD